MADGAADDRQGQRRQWRGLIQPTRYNFLRYSDSAGGCSTISPHDQNRVRPSDFRALHEQHGFEVLEEDPLERLRSVPLARRFAGYDEDDLAVYESWMVSRPRG